jgi:hypothetical protein
MLNRQRARIAVLTISAFSALALLNLIPAVSRLFAVVSYVLVDLRWWWTAGIAAWVAASSPSGS